MSDDETLVPLHEYQKRAITGKGNGTRIGGLKILHPIAWEGVPVPERRWIVPGLVPARTVTMIAGDGGTGKSLLALQLLVAASLGKPFLGFQMNPIKTLGVFTEDEGDELQRRLSTMLPHFEMSFADLERMDLVSRVGLPSELMTFGKYGEPGETTDIHADILNHAVDQGAELVVLDSLYDFFVGNQNDTPQVRQFVAGLREIALEIDGAVVLIAHPSRAGLADGSGTSGSVAWNNSVRSRLYLRYPADTEENSTDHTERLLQLPKANYAPAGGEFQLKLDDGIFHRIDQPGGILGTISRQNVDDAFVVALAKLSAQGRDVTESPQSPRFGPKVMSRITIDGRRYRETELRQAMSRLFDSGRIKMGEITGPDRHKRRAIVAVETPVREQ